MKRAILVSILTITGKLCFGQGCSDAGFCSLGALKEVNQDSTSKHILDIGSNIGFGEQNTFTFNPYLQYNYEAGNHFSFQAKVTATFADGFLGRIFEVGDIYGLATYAVNKHSLNSFRVLAGVKIPLTSANSKNAEGKPLPLDYQSSIGTYDIITGVNYIVRQKLELAAGLQLPVVQINKNSFFPEEYGDPRAKEFPPTNNFRRKPDLLLRAGYYVKLSPSVNIKPNLLAIYHTGDDTYQNRFGNRTSIDGSAGLTVNAGIIATKRFNTGNRLEFLAAATFIAREVRADGLTRTAAFTLQYSIPL
ncbi:MAG: hypothetical protein EOO09_00290 [Chitinophagaceae bacterium]|nr:MAG: hypothetical protein EOO09_00290 [Chitinophagaceae bacterium]